MQIGLERVFEHNLDLIKGKRLGLIVNPASINSEFQHTADLFFKHSKNKYTISALFGPQHGIRGETQDNMIEWEGWPKDSLLGVPVYSLYGKTRKPTPQMLEDIDTLVFDIQDVGTRVYTFIYTMVLSMQAAKEANISFIVLDRPNPITGTDLEGPVLDPNYASFVGMFPIPMRHGMTIGELANYFNEEYKIGCDLKIVHMVGWKRQLWFDKTWLPWVLTSPNMPTLDTAIVYPGMVLFEGTTISEGRGTTRPFEIIGAPYIEPHTLTNYLNDLNLPGVHFRPIYFQPTFHKYTDKICGGLQLHVLNRASFRSVQVAIEILKAIFYFYPTEFGWKAPPYEYEENKLPFDIIVGGNTLRKQIESNQSWNTIISGWEKPMEKFISQRSNFLIYD